MPCRIPARLVAALAAALVACAPAGGTGSLSPALPAAPLDSMPLASDVRLDSAGYLAGSFVGEGTSRRIHLLSSDTALVEALARRFRPDLVRSDTGLWEALRRAGAVRLSRPEVRLAMVGSPLGHTEITLSEVRLLGSRCGGGGGDGAGAELIVETDPSADDPPLRGPVLGTFLAVDASRPREGGLVRRPEVPEPSAALARRLIERTAQSLDSIMAARHPRLGLRPLATERIEINTLADLDAADVVTFRAVGGIRYAVSLRQRRVTGAGDTLVAAAVTAWDADAARGRDVFHPTLLSSAGGRLGAFGPDGRAIYWRRLQPVSDIAYRRDNLWMEQVDVREGRVVWGIVQPDENVVVAAAEVDGGCG